MPVAQSGVLALGTSSHAYLEFDRTAGTSDAALVGAVAELAATVKTTGATGLVVGVLQALVLSILAVTVMDIDAIQGFDIAVLTFVSAIVFMILNFALVAWFVRGHCYQSASIQMCSVLRSRRKRIGKPLQAGVHVGL